MPELWDAMEPLTLVIPTVNAAETIGGVIREISAAYRLDIIVADDAAPGVCRPGRRIWHRGTLRCEVLRQLRASPSICRKCAARKVQSEVTDSQFLLCQRSVGRGDFRV